MLKCTLKCLQLCVSIQYNYHRMQVGQRLDSLIPLGSQSGTSDFDRHSEGKMPTRAWECQGPLEIGVKED